MRAHAWGKALVVTAPEISGSQCKRLRRSQLAHLRTHASPADARLVLRAHSMHCMRVCVCMEAQRLHAPVRRLSSTHPHARPHPLCSLCRVYYHRLVDERDKLLELYGDDSAFSHGEGVEVRCFPPVRCPACAHTRALTHTLVTLQLFCARAHA